MPLETVLEAILFWKSEPMSVGKLSSILKKTPEEVKAALDILEKNLAGRGVQLLFKEDEVMLGTRSEIGPLIEFLIKEDLSKDLGKAGLETLSIVLYRGPIARRDIDYIRGVNSNFILRNLQVRGLVEKVQSPTDQRSFLYKPTIDLFSYLGISRIEELPEYEAVRKEIAERQSALENDTNEGEKNKQEEKA
jgi:segregation and condensation protein B